MDIVGPSILGFSRDCTEHVLWRLNHGEIDGIAPKLAVVMIGTNNIGARRDPPEETAAGIQAILSTLRTGLPDTKILLLGVFPRGASGDDPLRQVTVAINALIRSYADNQRIFFLDLSPVFLDDQERLSHTSCPITCTPMNTAIRYGRREWRHALAAIGRIPA